MEILHISQNVHHESQSSATVQPLYPLTQSEVSIRLPSGQRITKRFRPDDPLEQMDAKLHQTLADSEDLLIIVTFLAGVVFWSLSVTEFVVAAALAEKPARLVDLSTQVWTSPFVSCFLLRNLSIQHFDQFPKRSLRDIEGGLTVPMKDAQVWKSEVEIALPVQQSLCKQR